MDIDKKEITQILMSFFQEEMAWEIMQCNPEISEDIKLATIKEIFDKYCTPKKRVIGNPETRSWGYDGVYNYNPDNCINGPYGTIGRAFPICDEKDQTRLANGLKENVFAMESKMEKCYNLTSLGTFIKLCGIQNTANLYPVFFFATYFKRTEQYSLNFGYTVKCCIYEGNIGGINLSATHNELFDSRGEKIYEWQNIDDDGDFIELFCHSNGNHYLIFRIDLYGYSVFEIESRKELHYIPSQSYPKNNTEKKEETFIWTGAEYNPFNNILLVNGCYWAVPYSVLLLDFSNPMTLKPAENWLDIRNIVDPEFERYDDIEYKGWDNNGDLLLRGNYNDRWESQKIKAEKVKTLLSKLE